MFVKDVSTTGFSPTTIALLGSEEESADYIAELKKQAVQYLTVQSPKTRMKALPIFYNDCFGLGSDLYECMKIISENSKDKFEFVQIVLAEFCDVQNETYVLDVTKIADYLNTKWNSKNDFKLAYDAYNQAFKQFRIRLEVMKAWIELINKLDFGKQDLSRFKSLKNDLLCVIENIQKDTSWKYKKMPMY